MNSTKTILVTGALLAGLAVIIGAFGAHALRGLLESNDRVSAFETGVLYHMFHSLAILVLGAVSFHINDNKHVIRAFWCFVTGILLFSGSLYGLSTVMWGWLGPITPIGGVFFIIGWAFLVLGVVKSKSS